MAKILFYIIAIGTCVAIYGLGCVPIAFIILAALELS